MRPIKGYEGLYWINKRGQIFSLRRQEWLKPKIDRDGYANVTLFTTRDDPFYARVHQLVMAAYGPLCPAEGYFPHHRNDDRSDNRIENLEWRTKRDGELPEGWFVYVLFTDRGMPFYVGGSHWRYRLSSHEKYREFKQRKRIGVVLRDGLKEEEAMQLETMLIAAMGVRPFGPLVNKANYRNFGWRHTEGHKQRVSLRHTGKVVSAHTRELISQARKGKPLSLEHREKISYGLLKHYR